MGVVPNEAMQYSYARPPQLAQSMQPAHVSYSSIRDPQHSLLATMNVEPVQFKSPLVASPSQKSRTRTGDNKVPVSAMVLPSQIVATKGPPFALNLLHKRFHFMNMPALFKNLKIIAHSSI